MVVENGERRVVSNGCVFQIFAIWSVDVASSDGHMLKDGWILMAVTKHGHGRHHGAWNVR